MTKGGCKLATRSIKHSRTLLAWTWAPRLLPQRISMIMHAGRAAAHSLKANWWMPRALQLFSLRMHAPSGIETKDKASFTSSAHWAPIQRA